MILIHVLIELIIYYIYIYIYIYMYMYFKFLFYESANYILVLYFWKCYLIYLDVACIEKFLTYREWSYTVKDFDLISCV